MSKPIILYHANCLDGTGAKYAAWVKYGDEGAHYIPVQYGQPIPEMVDLTSEEEVYVLDFSYSKEVILRLREQHDFVMIIDHHKTAEAELTGLDHCIFDMTKSGAVLAWEFFHPGKEIPTILLHVQDRDLWNWAMPNTKEITTGLTLLKGDMDYWDTTRTHRLFESGRAICSYLDDKVDSATKPERVAIVDFLGKPGSLAIINSTGYSSEVCQAMYTKYPIELAISYFIEVSGEVILSLRSNKDKVDCVDVSLIAEEFFGGGGHKNAAGGKTDLVTLQSILKGEFNE